METTASPARAGFPLLLTAACATVPLAFCLSPVQVLAAAAGTLAGAVARHVLTRTRHGPRASPLHCELPTGLLWTVIASLWQWGVVATPWLAVLLPLTWVAVPLVVTDLHHRRLPRVLTVALGVLALPLLSVPALVEGWPLLANAVLGGAFTWALHAAAHRLSPASLGRGDVLLAAPTGAVQAASGPHALLLGTLLASVITVLLHLARRRPGHWRSGIPHAPGVLAATTLVTLLHAPLA